MAGNVLDRIDHKILAELTKDARTPLVALAGRVHLSRNAVRQRIERMERDGVIRGYTVLRGDLGTASKQVTAVLFVYRKDRMEAGGRLLSELATIPEVTRCDVLSGEFDVLVAVQADTIDRVGEIWEQIAAMPGVTHTVTSVSLATVLGNGRG